MLYKKNYICFLGKYVLNTMTKRALWTIHSGFLSGFSPNPRSFFLFNFTRNYYRGFRSPIFDADIRIAKLVIISLKLLYLSPLLDFVFAININQLFLFCLIYYPPSLVWEIWTFYTCWYKFEIVKSSLISVNMGKVMADRDEELALFLEMRRREKENEANNNSINNNTNSDQLDSSSLGKESWFIILFSGFFFYWAKISKKKSWFTVTVFTVCRIK